MIRYCEQVGAMTTKVHGYKIPITFLELYMGNITNVVENEDTFLTKIILVASKQA